MQRELTNKVIELSARQRFELALRCVEAEDTAAVGDNLVEPFAELIRFAAAERITPEMFDRRDSRAGCPLMHAMTAVTILAYPEDFCPGSLCGRALIAAGFADLVGTDDEEDEDE